MDVLVVCDWCQELGNSPGPTLPDEWVMLEDLMNLQLCCPACAKNNLPGAFDA